MTSTVLGAGDISLATIAKKARNLLWSCRESLEKERDAHSKAATQLSRFDLWASNIGIFSLRHSSLDYRLRTAPVARAVIDGNMEILCKHILGVLTGRTSLTDGERDDFTSTLVLNVASFGFKLYSRSSTTKEAYDIRLLSLKQVAATIDILHDLSLAIRNSSVQVPSLVGVDQGYIWGRTTEELQSKSGLVVDSMEFEATAIFEDFISSVLQLRWFSNAVGKTLDCAQKRYREAMLRRCVAVISVRRRQLTYFQNYQAKLAKPIPEKILSESQKEWILQMGRTLAFSDFDPRMLFPRVSVSSVSEENQQDVYIPVIKEASKSSKSEKPEEDVPVTFLKRASKISMSEESKQDISIPSITRSPVRGWLKEPETNIPIDFHKRHSVFSVLEKPKQDVSTPLIMRHSSTSHPGIPGPFEVPPPPRLASIEKVEGMTCPYCYFVCPAKTFSTKSGCRRWKKHLIEDLQPYVCLFENCDQAGKAYRNFRQWQAHLSLPHVQSWVCPLTHEEQGIAESEALAFNTVDEVKEHIDIFHSDINPTSLHKLLHGASQRAKLPRWCFVCLAEQSSDSTLQRHMAKHLEDAFILSLPERDDIRDSDQVLDSHSSSDSALLTSGALSSRSISEPGIDFIEVL